MRLPPDVSFDKRTLSDGTVAYVFRHQEVGELGRVLVQARGQGACQCTAEVCGDLSDPMTERRRAIFVPLGTELLRQLEEATAHGKFPAVLPPPPLTPAPEPSLIESKLIPCEKCDAPVALLIFANAAAGPGYLEDCARLMYSQYSRMDVPTWIVGPPVGTEPFPERPADVLQVWPTRGTIQRLAPPEFNPLLDALMAGHCR